MKLFIKSMVSERCRMIVEMVFATLNVGIVSIKRGVADTKEEVSEHTLVRLQTSLRAVGLELISDKKLVLIERIKHVIIDSVRCPEKLIRTNFSDYISHELNYSYNHLASVFVKVKGMSILQFIILIKVEKVKELLLYNELNLAQISRKLHYSSASHLTNQFKRIAGVAPSFFKRSNKRRSQNLDEL